MFKGRHFDRTVILLCVRWYLAYNLSLRDLEEMMAERGISVDHATIHRGVIRYSPKLLKRYTSRKRAVTAKWHVDEAYIKVRGRWTYLYRAIDSNGDNGRILVQRTAQPHGRQAVPAQGPEAAWSARENCHRRQPNEPRSDPVLRYRRSASKQITA
jgi:hypothetical protein